MAGSERGTSAIHAAMRFSYTSHHHRDFCWSELPDEVRERLTEIVGGQIVEWWAKQVMGDKHVAVALGPAGLCFADEAKDPAGRPAYRLRTARFAPESLWVLDKGAPDPLPSASEAAAGDGAAMLASSLGADFRGLIGHLPPITQIVLQERFTPRPGISHHYYVEQAQTPEQTTWRFLCYLADETTLAFGAGTKVTTPAADGGADAREVWDVTCYRATVTEPMPGNRGPAAFVPERVPKRRRTLPWLTTRPGS